MDLIISYKSRFRLRIAWIFLILGILFPVADSWRISQKCPHGHYYNDGCTACWCDTNTGETKCEKLRQCTRVITHVKCPRGRQYKDSCGNDCTCYEKTGSVLCNEIRPCPQENPVNIQMPSSVSNNVFLKRGGMAAPYMPPIEEHSIHFPGSTTAAPPWPTSPTTAVSRHNEIFENNFGIYSTPHPHLRIPNSRSEELIIEPAIIVRKKGSNKASIVRNPSSATSVTLPSSRRRNQGHNIILNKSDNKPASALAPLLLYEKQLQTIMNIRRAYTALLRSKVNFNFQIAAGKNPLPTPVNVDNNEQQNSFIFQPKNDVIMSSTDHPRRFDSDYDNSTILVNTTPSPFRQQPQQLPPNLQFKPFQPLVWRKEIKNVLKQFSPVPPLKQFVSYVSTSTENYLRDFLNNVGHKIREKQEQQYQQQQQQQQPVLVTPSPQPTTPAPLHPLPTMAPRLASSQLPYPFEPYSTMEPMRRHPFDPNTVPIHEIYQNHDFKEFTTTATPAPPPPFNFQNSYLHKTLGYPTDPPNNQFIQQDKKNEHFPFMNELIREIARMDTSSTPRTSPKLTALPTFQTPGPPYAEIGEVRPLSFLPPPKPATPTRRTFTLGQKDQHPPPFLQPQQYHHSKSNVRINLDKPIYINSPPQHPPPQHTTLHHNHPQHTNVQHPPPQQQKFPPIQQFSPQQTNRRIHTIPQRTHSLYPQKSQLNHHILYHHNNVNQQNNNQHRPLFSHHFFPKPKQYRLVLKGPIREAAVRVDDVVPRFVNKIAHEFFKKPEIYIPKIRPGKPLTLEKVILNHKAIVPTEMTFSPTPGALPTKLRFSPQAQWEMREELAKQGIMLDEPLNPKRDYVANDPNVMEMDSPLKAIQTWETHAGMGMDALRDSIGGGGFGTQPLGLPQNIQSATQFNPFPPPAPTQTVPQIALQQPPIDYQQQQELRRQIIQSAAQQQRFNPFQLPTPAPTVPQIALPPPTLAYHHQELQHQLILAQQQHQQNQQAIASASNNNGYKMDFGDFNDFKHTPSESHDFPQELHIPGVEQVVVDKYLVHDPLDPSGNLKMYSTTTVQPSTVQMNVNLAPPSALNQQHHRNGLAMLPTLGSTPPPAVLVRHHGAPSPTTPSPPPTQPSMPISYSSDNFFVTVINSTPQPFVSTTISPVDHVPFPQMSDTKTDILAQTRAGIVSQIHDFLADEMDFGARPHSDLYEMLFHRRTGVVEEDEDQQNPNTNIEDSHIMEHNTDEFVPHDEEHHHDDEDQTATETKISGEDQVDTDRVASIFSIDYKNKYNRKPPSVIVIKVPADHSDGPFPKVVEKRRGDEIEIQGTNPKYNSSSSKMRSTTVATDHDDDYSVEASTENSITTTTLKSVRLSSESSDDGDDPSREELSLKQRRRNRKKKRRERRRKKKGRARDRSERERDEDSENDEDEQTNESNKKEQKASSREREHSKSQEERKTEEDLGEQSSSSSTSKPETAIEVKNEDGAEEKFQSELDWKSQLMANICDLNPSSPLCLTYRSICLLMTSDD